MADVVVTVPLAFGLINWIDEGDAAGAPWSGEEWDFYLAGARPNIKPGERVYVCYNGALRGYAPLMRLATAADSYFVRRRGEHAFSLVRGGGAVAATIPEYIQGFRGWRYRWWKREDEVPFPNWQDPQACIGFSRKDVRQGRVTPQRPHKSDPAPVTPVKPGATRVVHCRKDAFDTYIGRAMPRYPELRSVGWGNPFREGKMTPDGWKSPIDLYREWLQRQPALLARRSELRGKRLGCWCAPKGGLNGDLHGLICHGEVLAAWADGQELDEPLPVTAMRVSMPVTASDPFLREMQCQLGLWERGLLNDMEDIG